MEFLTPAERRQFNGSAPRKYDGGDRWISEPTPDFDAEPVTEVNETGEIATFVSVTAIEFPVNALPGAVGAYVAAQAEAIGCDASFVALPMLACLARAVGNRRVIRLKTTWTEPAVIWGVIVGKSGTHKSPALQSTIQFLERRQSSTIAGHVADAEQYEQDLACYERDMAAWRKLRNSTEPPPSKPAIPTCERFITSDSTIEALASILAGQADSILVVRDELAGWLGGIAEYKGGKGSDLGHWLSCWSGAPLTVDRKTGAVRMLHVPRAAVSLVGGIQPGVLQSAIGHEHLQDGLCARLLMAMPEPRPVRWTEAIVDFTVTAPISEVFNRLFELEADVDPEGNIGPRPLDLTDVAKPVWVDYFNRHRTELAQLDDDMAAAWSKLEAYTARFALIFQLCSWAAGEADGDSIDESSMRSAIDLSEWFGNEAKRVYGLFVESQEQRECRELADIIKRRGGRITSRDLAHGSRRHRGPGEADAALELLVKARLGSWHVERTAGRPKREFILHTVTSGNGNGSAKTSENGALSLPPTA